MASSPFGKTEMFSNVEAISGFPYIPTHSGIASIYIARGAGGGSVVEKALNITDGTTSKTYNLRSTTIGDWDAETLVFPVIAGHQYTVTGDTNNVDFTKSFLTY